MGTKKSVFASKAERRNFYHLSRQWGDSYRLYHNLPFLNIFDTNDLTLIDVTSGNIIPEIENVRVNNTQFGRLLRTSVDYTLCDLNDNPIVCVEFDGLNDGHNFATKYVPTSEPEHRRRTMLELKLRVAHGSSFPFFVVGYDQFKPLVKGLQLTIVDGLIGDVVSADAALAKQAEGFSPKNVGLNELEFEALTKSQQVEIIGEWFEGCELAAKYECNPIYQRSAELSEKLMPTVSTEWLDTNDNTVGRKCTVTIADGESATAKVWMPHFRSPGSYSSNDLCQKIAQLIAMEQLVVGELAR